MNRTRFLPLPLALFWVSALVLSWGTGCEHTPFVVDEPFVPVDTTGTMEPDTTGTVDTTGTGEPCDPEIVYFSRDVLPLLIGNCATAGCHSAQDRADGVNLTTYASVIATADVRPFDLDGSDLYEAITEDREDRRMPPSPRDPLSGAQINLISTWILQGAEDLMCTDAGGCDTTMVSFAADIEPILDTGCRGCHSAAAPSGGVNLATYEGVRAVADDGRLYGAVARLEGFSPMPQGGPRLEQCLIDQIGSWVEAGAPDN